MKQKSFLFWTLEIAEDGSSDILYEVPIYAGTLNTHM